MTTSNTYTLTVYEALTNTTVHQWTITIPPTHHHTQHLTALIEKTIDDNLYLIPGIDSHSIATTTVNNLGFPVDIALTVTSWYIIVNTLTAKPEKSYSGTKLAPQHINTSLAH